MHVPSNLQYTSDHEWVSIDADIATVGITEFAADALGDIVYVDLPTPGSQLVAGEACGEIESTKSVSDLNAPIDGEVTEVNEAVVSDPSLLNSDPFEAGWLLKVRISGPLELLSPQDYSSLIEAQS
ncbi:glycine cleavage system protein GcvH [Janibacter melonis]|uniref:glycine cleavage system protein GcvH n=1 Tax=Janibacter melonis TaxID=262209 RepID=UPI00174DA3F0|nr:glycine cleavage system protein GcvH [Janibacter melonis]